VERQATQDRPAGPGTSSAGGRIGTRPVEILENWHDGRWLAALAGPREGLIAGDGASAVPKGDERGVSTERDPDAHLACLPSAVAP
jgi:hypothetical protein